MQNVTTLPAKQHDTPVERPAASLSGGIIGFFAYLLALATPFFYFGASVLFFFMYTWPFFLALLPVSVITGIALSIWFNNRLVRTLIFTLLIVISFFWVLFSFLAGWK
ncbi:membrane protein [Tatumella morbirosei]|uniref:Membrane protein n=1 Tax=Tatumella morbirosei TaxID=642227 RepID=A0A095VKH5_9GAMM|nr:DUF3561 family protein [Tatumella morbirosei]KGD75075.1 membrane protein [Tatumella morbirosei]